MSKEHYQYIFSSAWSNGSNMGDQEVASIEFDSEKITRLQEAEFFSCIVMPGEEREPDQLLYELGIRFEHLKAGKTEKFGNSSGMPRSLRGAIADVVNHLKATDDASNVRYIVVNSVKKNDEEGEKNFVAARRDAKDSKFKIYGYRDGAFKKDGAIDRNIEVKFSDEMDLLADDFPKPNKVVDRLETIPYGEDAAAGKKFSEIYGAASSVQMQMPYRSGAEIVPNELKKRQEKRLAS